MKKNKAKKKLIRAYSIIALMVLSTFAWTMTNGAGHGVTITKPVNNSVYNNLYNKARVTTEKTALTFDFTIDNHDGYLIAYSAWIDGVADPKLNDPNWDPSSVLAHYVISYDAQQFLDNYGQGSHSFTVAIYHGTPYVRPPFGLQEGDNPDDDDIYWVDNHGYLLSLVDEVSVTFTFDPVVVHYAGFWFEGIWRYKDDNGDVSLVNHCFSNNVLVFRDFLCSENAHYLHGYTFLTGSCYSGSFTNIAGWYAGKPDEWTYLPYLTVLASSKATETSKGIKSHEYDKDCELTEKIDNIIQKFFTRALIRALYYEYDLVRAMDLDVLKWYDYSPLYTDWYGVIKEGIQHPVHSEFTFTEELYFYVGE